MRVNLLFSGAKPPRGTSPAVRRILMLNWRDIYHPRSGGAEKVTHEVARRWVQWGHQVTLFTAAFPGSLSEEWIDGVRVVRRGSQQSVHWHAYRYYNACGRDDSDLIIDEVNTIPFFAPLYVRKPVIMYSNQLAREVWRYEAPFPLSVVGRVAEPLYLQAYRRTPVMTISQSTKDDLLRLGLAGPYHIIPMAIDMQVPRKLPPVDIKERPLTLCFVGRVVPSKRVDHIIEALGHIHRSGQADARLWIVGSWDAKYRHALDRRIREEGLGDHVTFFGRVDTATKERLLSRAHLFVMASVREGWGLVVTEANAMGTPAIVYDVPGLRDSTVDGVTGVVCKQNTPMALGRAVVALRGDPVKYSRMRVNAWRFAKTLSWDRTARAAWNAVEACL